MKPLLYFDRNSHEVKEEKIYGEGLLRFIYGSGWVSSTLLKIIAHLPLFSKLVGLWQKMPWTRRSISPFIQIHKIDIKEFENAQFKSFNDFFIRRLKKESRPIGSAPCIMPADARYRFFTHLDGKDSFFVKGSRFSLSSFLASNELAMRFEGGSLVMARLAPPDYHRFHFPIDCIPSKPRLIRGPLYSVNPIALNKCKSYLLSNKRMITSLDSKEFGLVLSVEVGATSVGSIHQTFLPNTPYKKGDEKGFFSFGGSALLLFFEKGRIQLEKDLTLAPKNLEIRCLMGQNLGRSNY